MSVEEILARCAGMRGVGDISGLSHRSIKEWGWFIEHMIFDKCEGTCMYPAACNKARTEVTDFNWNDPDTISVIRKWAELFLIYCIEAYHGEEKDAT